MTGICAMFRPDGSPVNRAGMERMLDALENWGDERASWVSVDGCVAIGCRRDGGGAAQPARSANDDFVVVADARIDNRDELIRALGRSATADSCANDAALILAAYEAWGEDCARRLIGDFAFALWDARRRTLFCVRDPIGQRVLYTFITPRLVAVASAIPALLAITGQPARLNEQKIADHLVLLEDATSTYYQGIGRLRAAHRMSVSERVRVRRYRELGASPTLILPTDAEYIEAFREVFGAAVRARLTTAGRPGIMLSGGLDSSSVAAFAALHLREQGRRLSAFHAAPRPGFQGATRPGWVVDESAEVREIAAMHDNIDLHVLRPSTRTPLDLLDDLFAALHAPVRNPGNLEWVLSIYARARGEGVSTLLTGQKGNTTISFTGLRGLRELARGGHWVEAFREAGAVARRRGDRTFNIFKDQVLRPLTPQPMLNAYARLHGRRRIADDGIPRWSGVAPDFAREMQVRERARAFGADDARLARANAKEYRILALEAAGDGPDVTHAFRTRYGIDTLDPTSDIRVIDFCLSVPSTQYLRNGRDRWLVRRALRGMLPPSVVDRTTRGAQSADWTEWFEAMRPMIVADIDTLERSDTARRCLDVPRMARLVREWPARLGVEHTIEYNLMLLRAIVVGRFIRWFEERHA